MSKSNDTAPIGRTLVIEALSLEFGRAFGYQEYLFNILDYLSNHRSNLNYDSVVIVCSRESRDLFSKYEPTMSIRSLSFRNRFHKYIQLNRLRTLLHLDLGDTILFTNNYSALTKQCRHVLVIHDLLYLRRNLVPSFYFRLQRQLFIPRSLSIADDVIAISEWVKKDIQQNFNGNIGGPVHAIHNFFNFGKFKQLHTAAAPVGNHFLVVSSNLSYKNTTTVLKAFTCLCENDQESRLIVVGKRTGEIAEFCEKLPRIISERIEFFHAISNEELGNLYATAKAFISATLFEGLGMPIVEAMYFNAPVIVSDLEVIREVTGGKALYFDPMDPLQLADRMREISRNPKRASTRSFVEDTFGADKTVSRYVSLLNLNSFHSNDAIL